jgi:hypothetical protein
MPIGFDDSVHDVIKDRPAIATPSEALREAVACRDHRCRCLAH